MTSSTWRCGHPRTPENTKAASPSTKARCLTCHAARTKRWRLANTTGKPRGRPIEFVEMSPIGITDSDIAFRDMVRSGTALLGQAVTRYYENGGRS